MVSTLAKLATIRKSLGSFKGQRHLHKVLQLSKADALPAASTVFSIAEDEKTQHKIQMIIHAASEGQEVKKIQLGYVLSNVLVSRISKDLVLSQT